MLELAVRYTPRTLATALYLITLMVLTALTFAARIIVSKKAGKMMNDHFHAYEMKRNRDTWFSSRKNWNQPVRWLWTVKKPMHTTVPIIRQESRVWPAVAAQ